MGVYGTMTRLEIIRDINPRYNYTLYRTVCEENGFDPRPLGMWAQFMGMVSAAETMYPDDSIEVAYSKFIADVNAYDESRVAEVPVPSAGCGSCGGGKVL